MSKDNYRSSLFAIGASVSDSIAYPYLRKYIEVSEKTIENRAEYIKRIIASNYESDRYNYFSFEEYVVLLITGMALSLLAQKIIQLFYRSDSIPLAGWLSVFYGLYMLITF